METHELAGVDLVLGNPGFTHGGANNHRNLAHAAVPIAFNGVVSAIAARAAAGGPVNDLNTGIRFVRLRQNECCMLLAQVNKDGAFGLTQGPIEKLVDGQIERAPQLGPLEPGYVPIGYLFIGTTNAAGFGPDAQFWDTAGSIIRSGSLATLPSRPPLTEL